MHFTEAHDSPCQQRKTSRTYRLPPALTLFQKASGITDKLKGCCHESNDSQALKRRVSMALPTPQHETHCDAKWYVLHCKPRQEQCVADALKAKRAHAYLPRIEQVRYYGKRKVKRSLPLFPGYVFLLGNKDNAYDVDRSRGIVQIIEPHDQDQLAWELENIQFAIQQDAPLIECASLKVGTRVEVIAGPFKGMQGLVEANRRDDRVVLQVSMLGRAMSVEIDASLLNKLDYEMDLVLS